MDHSEDLSLIRAQVAVSVPLEDCSGRTYSSDEREDIIRYMLFAAEMQRNKIERIQAKDTRLETVTAQMRRLRRYVLTYGTHWFACNINHPSGIKPCDCDLGIALTE